MLCVEPCDATFGATVTGVSLEALDDDGWERIATAFARYALLIFPGQHLDPEAQRDFARRFGPLETELMGDEPVVVRAADLVPSVLRETPRLARCAPIAVATAEHAPRARR